VLVLLMGPGRRDLLFTRFCPRSLIGARSATPVCPPNRRCPFPLVERSLPRCFFDRARGLSFLPSLGFPFLVSGSAARRPPPSLSGDERGDLPALFFVYFAGGGIKRWTFLCLSSLGSRSPMPPFFPTHLTRLDTFRRTVSWTAGAFAFSWLIFFARLAVRAGVRVGGFPYSHVLGSAAGCRRDSVPPRGYLCSTLL